MSFHSRVGDAAEQKETRIWRSHCEIWIARGRTRCYKSPNGDGEGENPVFSNADQQRIRDPSNGASDTQRHFC